MAALIAACGRVAHAQTEELHYEERAELTLYAEQAELSVQVQVRYDGPEPVMAEEWFEADGAVAVGLALRDQAGGWVHAKPWEAFSAAARFGRLAGPGYARQDPGLVRRMYPGAFQLWVLPVVAEPRTFEYRVLLPTRYEAGAHWVTVARAGLSELVVRSGVPGAELLTPSGPLRPDTRRGRDGVPPGEDGVWRIGLAVPGATPLSGRLVLVPLARRHFARFELHAAPELARAPDDASLVIAIDASRSMGLEGVRAAREAAREYVAHFRRPHVRVLYFAKETRWAASLADAPELSNGSDVARALHEAARALAPSRSAKRILLLTDGRTAEVAHVPAVELGGALVHVAVLQASSGRWLARDDQHPWAAVASATGGVLWRMGVPGAAAPPGQLRRLVEPWARPVQVERAVWSSDGLDVSQLPNAIDPGVGYVAEGFLPARPTQVTLRGWLWSRPVELRFSVDATASRAWRTLLLGHELSERLTPSEDAALADSTGSASRTRSLLAVEPGAKPAGGAEGSGLDFSPVSSAEEFAMSSQLSLWTTPESSCVACWDREVVHTVAGGLEVSTPELREHSQRGFERERRALERVLRGALLRCGVSRATARVETTLDEIVAVRVDDPTTAAASCVAAALWSHELSGSHADRAVFELQVP